MDRPLVELSGISKSFPGVCALDRVPFDLKAGEVHAVLGENGAGKSTLMKIIGGVEQPDAGSYRFAGRSVEGLTPKQAQQLGIAFIHQELNLCADLTVAENIFLGREDCRFGFVRQSELDRRAGAILDRLGLDIDPRQVIGKLPVAQRQLVEIAKALATEARVLIMDEPSSALSARETAELFAIVRELKRGGCGVVYITHRLDELAEIADRVSIYRDGRHVATMPFAETTLESIIAQMVGREIKEKYPRQPARPGREILTVDNLVSGPVRGVSFKVHAGEIVGIGGLIGAGRTELVRALFGAEPIASGTIALEGKVVRIASPRDAIAHGLVLGPEDRKKEGLCTELSIRENLGLPNLDRICDRLGFVRGGRERAATQRAIVDLRIKTPSAEQVARNLSGGNQQKVVLGKWLLREARLVIFDEPTRGIDVAAKLEIYALMNDLKAKGIGVLFVSSEMPEVLGMSDRILVMCAGRITGELPAREATQDEILRCATRFRMH